MSDVEKLARAMCDVDMEGDADHVLCTWKRGVSVNYLHAWESYKELAQKAIDMLAMSDEKRTPVTDSEKLADQMAADITSGKVATKDRPVVRKALDTADAYDAAREKTSDVWRRATGRYMPGRGGAMKPNNWRMGPDGEPREVD